MARSFSDLKGPVKLLIMLLVIGVVVGVGRLLHTSGILAKIVPTKEQSVAVTKKDLSDYKEKTGLTRPIRVGTVTWGGYAGGQYFNGGFKASTESRYYKDYGILVEFVNNDDVPASRQAFTAGEVDVMWTTADALPHDGSAFFSIKPKILFQADWSRGGDAIVAARGIRSFNDLKGKKVSVAVGTPSYTLLVTCLQAAGLSISDITVVKVGSAIESAQFFKSNQVDAAVVWSPDDADCVKNVAGATILTSTKTASYRIADVFVTSSKFLDSHEKELKALVEGWMIGSAEINTNPAAKQAAIKILSSNLNLDDATSELMLNNARLTTYGDNLNFFGLNSSYKGIKGEDLYNTMTEIYKGLGEIPSAPFWRSLISTSIINSLNLTGNGHEAEGQVAFTKATREEAVAPAVSTKKVSINFNTGIFQLSEKHKRIIDIQFSEIAKGFGNARVRIEGNTDNVGSRDFNVSLSGKRAKSVASYLVQEYGYDSNRFIVVGNGPDQPVAENTTDEGRSQNRRTDFELVP